MYTFVSHRRRRRSRHGSSRCVQISVPHARRLPADQRRAEPTDGSAQADEDANGRVVQRDERPSHEKSPGTVQNSGWWNAERHGVHWRPREPYASGSLWRIHRHEMRRRLLLHKNSYAVEERSEAKQRRRNTTVFWWISRVEVVLEETSGLQLLQKTDTHERVDDQGSEDVHRDVPAESEQYVSTERHLPPAAGLAIPNSNAGIRLHGRLLPGGEAFRNESVLLGTSEGSLSQRYERYGEHAETMGEPSKV